MISDEEIGGDALPDDIRQAAKDFVFSIDEERLVNGRTAFYWNVVHILLRHIRKE